MSRNRQLARETRWFMQVFWPQQNFSFTHETTSKFSPLVFTCFSTKTQLLPWDTVMSLDSNNCLWQPDPQVSASVQPWIKVFLLSSPNFQPRHIISSRGSCDRAGIKAGSQQHMCSKTWLGLWHHNKATKSCCWCHLVARNEFFYGQLELSEQSAEGIAVFLNNWSKK